MNEIKGFNGEYQFLSNFYPCKIVFNGLTFTSVEAAFQSAKCLEPEQQKEFQDLAPREAKQKGRAAALRPDWEERKVAVMRRLLGIKFRDDPELLGKLLSTGGRLLTETNTWHDNFWGDCTCAHCANIRGENMLGKLLMELRGSLLEDGKQPLQMPDPGFQGDVGFQMRQLAHGEFLDQPQQAGPVFRVAGTTYRLNWAAANLLGTDAAAAKKAAAEYLRLDVNEFHIGGIAGLSDVVTIACVTRVSGTGAPAQK